jgi:hypothetical protein
VVDVQVFTFENGEMNGTVSWEFGQDEDAASHAAGQYPPGGPAIPCFYMLSGGGNSSTVTVAMDLPYTTWKWIISALFGMVPLVAVLGFALCYGCHQFLRWREEERDRLGKNLPEANVVREKEGACYDDVEGEEREYQVTRF